MTAMHCLVRDVQDHEHSHTVMYTFVEHGVVGMLECAEFCAQAGMHIPSSS